MRIILFNLLILLSFFKRIMSYKEKNKAKIENEIKTMPNYNEKKLKKEKKNWITRKGNAVQIYTCKYIQ